MWESSNNVQTGGFQIISKGDLIRYVNCPVVFY